MNAAISGVREFKKRMAKASALFTFFVWFTSMAFAAGFSHQVLARPMLCRDAFVEVAPKPDGTTTILAYLGELWTRKIVGREDLIRMQLGLADGKVINPLFKPERNASLKASSAVRAIHAKALQKIIDRTNLNVAVIVTWIQKLLQETESAQVKRTRIEQDTSQTWQKMEFRRIEGGEIVIDGKLHRIHDLDVMGTVVTQHIWFTLMGQNPAHFSNDSETVSFQAPDNKTVTMQPDHPIENITVWSAIVFANELSKKDGLPPAYDFNGVTWRGDAANGTLAPSTIESAKLAVERVLEVEIHPERFVGYRLPTTAELIFLRTNRNRDLHTPLLPLKTLNKSVLANHAWYLQNSDKKTHSVVDDRIQNLFIDGQELRDLFGNVAEFSGTFGYNLYGWEINIVGEGYSTMYIQFDVRRSARYQSHIRHNWVGFRLVRTAR